MSLTVEPEDGGTTVFGHTVSDIQTDVAIAKGRITGTLHKVTSGALARDWGEGYFVVLKWASSAPSGVTSEKVGLDPSMGSGLVEAINDPDHNGVFKVTNKATQDFVVVLDGESGMQNQRYDLSGLTLD